MLVASVGCVDRYDPAENDTGQCEPGAENCACLDGLCQFGLVCEADVCIGVDADLPEPDPDADDDDMTGSDETGPPPPGSCDGHCGECVADGTGQCCCTPTCAAQGTCCDDHAEACSVASGCATNDECPDGEVCSAGTNECLQPYGHVFDVYVYFEDMTGTCWDEPEACAPDPYYVACLTTSESCSCPSEPLNLDESYEVIPDSNVASWPAPFSYTPQDGHILIFGVFDWDAESPPGDDMIGGCCVWAFAGTSGAAPLTDGTLACSQQNRLLRATFVAR